MIQTTTGTVDENAIGDFDVLVAVGGRVEHYRRNNDDFRAHRQPQNGPGAAWNLVDSFGRSANDLVYVWSFIQGPFYQNFEAVVENGFGSMEFWFYSAAEEDWVYGEDAPAVD